MAEVNLTAINLISPGAQSPFWTKTHEHRLVGCNLSSYKLLLLGYYGPEFGECYIRSSLSFAFLAPQRSKGIKRTKKKDNTIKERGIEFGNIRLWH